MSLSPVLLDHFKAPRNAGRIASPTGRGHAENEACGDVLDIEVRVVRGTIEAAGFLAQGCSALIACASFVTSRAIGGTVANASALDSDVLLAEADEPGATRRHGMTMAVRALHSAIAAGA